VRRRNRNLALAAAAVVMWALAIYAWNDAGAREVAGWQARIAELKPGAERSAALRRRMEALSQEVTAANASDPVAMLAILKELTHVLPDTARVVDLKIDGDRVEISGLARSAPPLIGLLEQSPLFADVKALSAFERRAESGNERFSLAMRLEKSAAP
jgi:general secretion pathway protein L